MEIKSTPSNGNVGRFFYTVWKISRRCRIRLIAGGGLTKYEKKKLSCVSTECEAFVLKAAANKPSTKRPVMKKLYCYYT